MPNEIVNLKRIWNLYRAIIDKRREADMFWTEIFKTLGNALKEIEDIEIG